MSQLEFTITLKEDGKQVISSTFLADSTAMPAEPLQQRIVRLLLMMIEAIENYDGKGNQVRHLEHNPSTLETTFSAPVKFEQG